MKLIGSTVIYLKKKLLLLCNNINNIGRNKLSYKSYIRYLDQRENDLGYLCVTYLVSVLYSI